MSAQARCRQSLRPRPEAKAVDAWLRQSLAKQFDDTLAEALPHDLAALVNRFGA